MSTRAVDISVVLTMKQDRLLAHNSLVSAAQALAHAEKSGLLVEILVVADRPDPVTTHYLDTARTLGATVHAGDFGAEAMARNAGIDGARGRHVAFLRGDRLWCTNWLVAAYDHIQGSAPNVILHPEATLVFGGEAEPCWVMHQDSDTSQGEWTNLALYDPWSSSSFARREIHVALPFFIPEAGTDCEASIWAWHCETVRLGCSHQTVPGTSHAERRDRVVSAREPSAPATRLFRNRLTRA